MEEADQLCGRVAFLSDGRIVALDTPSNLKVALAVVVGCTVVAFFAAVWALRRRQ